MTATFDPMPVVGLLWYMTGEDVLFVGDTVRISVDEATYHTEYTGGRAHISPYYDTRVGEEVGGCATATFDELDVNCSYTAHVTMTTTGHWRRPVFYRDRPDRPDGEERLGSVTRIEVGEREG